MYIHWFWKAAYVYQSLYINLSESSHDTHTLRTQCMCIEMYRYMYLRLIPRPHYWCIFEGWRFWALLFRSEEASTSSLWPQLLQLGHKLLHFQFYRQLPGQFEDGRREREGEESEIERKKTFLLDLHKVRRLCGSFSSPCDLLCNFFYVHTRRVSIFKGVLSLVTNAIIHEIFLQTITSPFG